MHDQALDWTATVLSLTVFVLAAIGVAAVCAYFLAFPIWLAVVCAIVLMFLVQQVGAWCVESIDDEGHP